MENQVLQNIQILDSASFGLQNLADSRIQALKSLASMLLKELEILERLTTKADKVDKKQKISLYEDVATFESEIIRTVLRETNGNQRKAADLLGVNATTLHSKLKRYGIDSRKFFDIVSGGSSQISGIQ